MLFRAARQQQLTSLLHFRAASTAALMRDARFSQLEDADVTFFESVLGRQGVVTDPHDLQPFNRCGALRHLDHLPDRRDGENSSRWECASQTLTPPA